PSTWKLPPNSSHCAVTCCILLMPSKEMRKTKIGMRSRRRSPLRNEFEVSPQIFWAECSTRWLSAQHFRSIIQPNYQEGTAPAGIAPGVGHHGAIPLLEDLGVAAGTEAGIIDGSPFFFIRGRIGLSLGHIVWCG